MSKLVKLSTLAGALALPATAYADTGAHHADIVTQAIHWLTSPAHALSAVVGGLVVSAAVIYFIRKRRA